MSNVDLGSASDLEALQRSGRGKFILLGVLLVGALAAAAWFFFRPQGTGNDEDPAKLIIVSERTGYVVALTDLGFDAATGSFNAWVNKAQDEVPDLEVDGIEAIMTIADRFGYAHVVFENPSEIDFSALDIDGGVPDFPDHVRFAVVSAGDFAFPHKLTVNPVPSKVMRGGTVMLLQALFEQEVMKELLPDNESPSMETIKLRDRLQDAVDRVSRVPDAEQMADKIVEGVKEQLDESERAPTKPTLVGENLEVTTPVPLPGGEVLSIAQGFSLVTRDAVRADLDLDDHETFLVGAPGADAEDREPCESLAGGTMSTSDAAKYWFAADGGAVLLKNLSAGMHVWTAAAGEGCAFTDAGEIAPARPGLGGSAPVPHASGKVARVGMVMNQGVVSVVEAGQPGETMLGMIDSVELLDATWLSERYLVARGEPRGGPSTEGLVFLDTERPMEALLLPATVFETGATLHEIAVGGPEGARQLVAVVSGEGARRVYAMALPKLESMFASPPVDAELELEDPANVRREREGEPTLVMLDPNKLSTRVVVPDGNPRSVAVSPDGTWITFRTSGDGLDPEGPGDTEIAVAPLSGSGAGRRLLTLNMLKDHSPRFTADGKHVVFRTRIEVPKTRWIIQAGRIAPVQP